MHLSCSENQDLNDYLLSAIKGRGLSILDFDLINVFN